MSLLQIPTQSSQKTVTPGYSYTVTNSSGVVSIHLSHEEKYLALYTE